MAGVQVRKLPPEEIPGATFLHDGEAIRAGDGSMRAVWTPGHSQDHCCFVDDSAREIYCGDLIRAGGTIVIAASRGGDLRAYLQSLERVRSLAPRRLFPGHGPAIEDPAAAIDCTCGIAPNAMCKSWRRCAAVWTHRRQSRLASTWDSIRRSNERPSTPSWRIWSSWRPKGECRNGARRGGWSSARNSHSLQGAAFGPSHAVCCN